MSEKQKTRWVVWDTEKQKLYDWQFFPSKKAAEAWMERKFGLLQQPDRHRPSWYPKGEWERDKRVLPRLRILRVRWSLSRHEVINGNHKGR